MRTHIVASSSMRTHIVASSVWLGPHTGTSAALQAIVTKPLGKQVSKCYNIRMRCIRIRIPLRMRCIHLQHYWLGTKLLGKEVSICYNILKQVYAYAYACAASASAYSFFMAACIGKEVSICCNILKQV
jgi:hypothetical protein